MNAQHRVVVVVVVGQRGRRAACRTRTSRGGGERFLAERARCSWLEGGTPLTVHGGGFSSSSESLGALTCRLGGAVRRARVGERGSALVCNATRAPAGESRVEVSNNAREYTSSGVRVRLVSVRVVDVHPWSGPVGGATVVRVRSTARGRARCAAASARRSSAAWSGGASRCAV